MLEQCVTSFVEGRVRLRHEALRRETVQKLVEQYLQGLDGVLQVTINGRNGSLLLEYDPDTLSKEHLQALLRKGDQLLGAFFLPASPDKGARRAPDGVCAPWALTAGQWRRVRNRALLASLLGAAALGFVGRGGAHTAASMFFLGLCAEHVWRYRNHL